MYDKLLDGCGQVGGDLLVQVHRLGVGGESVVGSPGMGVAKGEVGQCIGQAEPCVDRRVVAALSAADFYCLFGGRDGLAAPRGGM